MLENTQKWFEDSVKNMILKNIQKLYEDTYQDKIKFKTFKVESFTHALVSYTAFCIEN